MFECRCGKRFVREGNYPKHLAQKRKVCLAIPKKQKRKLSICPECKVKFYYWQKAARHSNKFKHYGDYFERK